jgi:hypothetical protein
VQALLDYFTLVTHHTEWDNDYDFLHLLFQLQRKDFITEIYQQKVYLQPIKNPQNLDWRDLMAQALVLERYPHHFEICYQVGAWQITFHHKNTTEHFETTLTLEAYNEIAARIVSKHLTLLSE